MSRFLGFFVAAVACGWVGFQPASVQAQGLAGAYLAANQASRDNNYEQAAKFYAEALSRDPNNPFLLQNALFAFVAKGDVDRAVAIATKVNSSEFGNRLADLVLISDAVERGDYDRAAEVLEDGKDRFNVLIAPLLQGWIELGLGQMSAAAKRFDSMTSPRGVQLFGQYHKALALASVGDFVTADRILMGDEQGNLRLDRGSLIAHAQIMSQLDRADGAIDMLDVTLAGTSDKGLQALRDQIAEEGAVDFDYIRDARDGVAEVFLNLAGFPADNGGDRDALVYARLAQFLRPTSTQAILLTAEILQDQDQFDLATRTYALVGADDPMFLNAELGRADALVDADKRDAAIEVLRGLTRTHGDVPRVHMSLGDALRGQERYDEASEAYDVAVNMIPTPAPNHWFLFYARGITHEREDRWELAEADFRRALELNPDQPLVLNYLGYSLVEKGMKLEEAQKMIETAVEKQPNSGFITDSLGWVLYRVGKFEEAVAPMEKAVSLESDDPIINDHLGDVYWMVGRKREARFQWSRALSFEPEDKDAVRIRRKLEVGLDAVLKEEKALEAAQGDGN